MKEIKIENEVKHSKPLNEIFIKRHEAATELGCSVSNIDNLRRKGYLRSYRIGGLVRFKREEIIIAIEESQKLNSYS